jgi:hypothetical protein
MPHRQLSSDQGSLLVDLIISEKAPGQLVESHPVEIHSGKLPLGDLPLALLEKALGICLLAAASGFPVRLSIPVILDPPDIAPFIRHAHSVSPPFLLDYLTHVSESVPDGEAAARLTAVVVFAVPPLALMTARIIGGSLEMEKPSFPPSFATQKALL